MGPTHETQLAHGRASYEQRAWGDAYAQLAAADKEVPLEPEDLERMGMAAQLLGKGDEGVEIGARAYRVLLERSNEERAARCAFWVGMHLINRGEMAPGFAWIARAGRLVGDDDHDCVEQGFLLVPVALQKMFAGDASSALTTFNRVAEVAERFDDPDLLALGCLGQGQASIQLGHVSEGVALLDEAMIGITAREVSPVVTGIVYCGVIDACKAIYDLRRAREWTAALNEWCSTQPDLVPFRGQCLVHRAEILQLQGAWSEALTEAQLAREVFARAPNAVAAGMALYQLGELHRLRGEFDEAEEFYLQANQHGHLPHPGLARLRLSRGNTDSARAAISGALDETRDPVGRAGLLPTFVETMIAVGDVPAARAGANELMMLSADFGTTLLAAVSEHVTGAVLLAEGDDRQALATLRRACEAWRELDVPYESARARVLMGLARRRLGDEDSAAMDFDSARRTFNELGAKPEVVSVEKLSGKPPPATGGLTGREVEVLGLVATGRTNRQIATELVISEKTVARHISNIFSKLQLSSRSAATAYAYKHDLV